MRCPECGLVWLNPRPIPEDIGKLYKIYFTHSTEDHIPKFARLRKLIRNSILATHLGYTELAGGVSQKMLGRILSWVGPIKEMVEFGVRYLNGQRRGKLLDIGCGSGAFLCKMRELGWDVVGVEFDRQAVKVAREHFGLNIYEGTLEEAGFSENEFDVLTMNHVIEHFYDPITTLKECYRVLKFDGKFVVITPNIDSLGHKLFKEAWRGLEPPRHLFVFSAHSLQACTKQLGLRVLKLKTTARLSCDIWAYSRLIRKNGGLLGSGLTRIGWRLLLEGLAFQVVEHEFSRIRNVGEEIVMVAIK